MWDVTQRTKDIFFGTFLIQTLAWLLWASIQNDRLTEIEQFFQFMESVIVVSATVGYVAAETAEGIMVLADSIRQRLERRRQRLDERLREEGREEGRVSAFEAWHEWNHRRVLAEKHGEPFDEPPPKLD
jgi:hypothetical protein